MKPRIMVIRRLMAILLITAMACNFSVPFSLLRAASSWLPESTAIPTSAPTPTDSLPTPQPQVYQITRTEESEDGTYTIELIHPELNNAGEAGEDFNRMVGQLLVSRLDDFKANVALLQDGQTQAGVSTLHLDFNLYRQDNRFVSLLLVEDVYYAGAAHPVQTHFAFNYNLPEGRFYELADLFLVNSPYVYALSEYCYEELRYAIGEQNVLAGGVSPVPDNFARWNITPNGLLITFEEYQVAAYAVGAPQVLVPYSVLEPYIDPAGPLENYLLDQEYDF